MTYKANTAVELPPMSTLYVKAATPTIHIIPMTLMISFFTNRYSSVTITPEIIRQAQAFTVLLSIPYFEIVSPIKTTIQHIIIIQLFL